MRAYQLPLLQHKHSIRLSGGFIGVRDDNHTFVIFSRGFAKQRHDLPGRVFIQISCWLICQDHWIL